MSRITVQWLSCDSDHEEDKLFHTRLYTTAVFLFNPLPCMHHRKQNDDPAAEEDKENLPDDDEGVEYDGWLVGSWPPDPSRILPNGGFKCIHVNV